MWRLLILVTLPYGVLNLPRRRFRRASWWKLENEDGSAGSIRDRDRAAECRDRTRNDIHAEAGAATAVAATLPEALEDQLALLRVDAGSMVANAQGRGQRNFD